MAGFAKSFVLSHAAPGSVVVRVIPFGATITSVKAPDRSGALGEVTCGFDEDAPYVEGRSPYFGCVAGRVANRTAGGAFTLDGADYALARNNGAHHLHGGAVGFDKRPWRVVASSATSVTLALRSEAGDEGYPGALDATVEYSLPAPNALRVTYAATTDAATPVNLTNHAYWNLEDGGASSVLGHVIALDAAAYTPVDGESIPTGEVAAAAGAMDLSSPTVVGARLYEADQGAGYDHNYVLGAGAKEGAAPAATVYAPVSGRRMTVTTDQPGIQFYTGNYLDGTLARSPGAPPYARHAGLCLETQKFPDALHRPNFPSIVLRPGETYAHETVHVFDACADADAAFAGISRA